MPQPPAEFPDQISHGAPVAMDAYDYELPETAIAQVPVEPRSAARLLVDGCLATSGTTEHITMSALPSLLRPGDVLVVNDTRVLAARLQLRKATGGSAEVLLLEPIDVVSSTWEALVRPGRRLPPGTFLYDDEASSPVALVGEWLAGVEDGRRSVRLLDQRVIDRSGTMPLPPYIRQRLADEERYQTVYSTQLLSSPEDQSTAAPTAGLHFTPELLDACSQAGATVVRVDLAIGLDTFRPITARTPEQHVIHTERYSVPLATWEACRQADRVIAVGTTSVRALESVAATGRLRGRTDLYIHGQHTFRMVDVLITNFHLPRSSLLLLVEAFCGPEWREHYQVALTQGYRFLSFGDAMVLARAGAKGVPVPLIEEPVATEGEPSTGGAGR